ncbi:MAG TPA: serine hydrolase [Thermoanaerobaculia bacterium]|nr:serine hydrolase [Thermoanaerobaculia bacterium]
MRFVFVLLLLATTAQASYRDFAALPADAALETKLRAAADATLAAYPKLKADDLAISMIDVAALTRADYHGETPMYPASVIKLFFMADVYQTRKEKLGDVDRALREMIVVSDNDATAYLVDILANTVPGPPLQGRALRRYIDRRRDINRRFERLGYTDVSAMMKPWSFGPYGVDLQVLGEKRVNRNKLTANATASLLLSIVRRRAVGAEAMMTLLERPLSRVREEENQVKEFIGEALPTTARLWSKAGWTSEVRHDAAYIELPDGKKLVLVIFTRGTAEDVTLIPAIARNVLNAL